MQEPVVAEVTFEEIDPAAVAHSRAPLAPVVAQLKKRFPNVLDYESRSSANLVIDASLIGAKFGDEDVAALKPLGDADCRSPTSPAPQSPTAPPLFSPP